ncbi:hypothetical protein BK708_20660 [Bacillus thuringiensis serovar yunnanensis]|nr:hypothetical protein BK708_20660 [Bacillus thuringiensis serovar yunnanensis]
MKRMILTHTLNNKTWFFCPVTIIAHNDNYIVFRISVGSPTFRAIDESGNYARMDSKHWNLSKAIWENHNLTYLVPFDAYIGYGVITDQNNRIINYYLNFQQKLEISYGVINTMDLELDFVINNYYTNEYHWKDLDEFNYLVSKQIFDENTLVKLIRDEKILLESFGSYKSELDIFSSKNLVTPCLNGLHKYIPDDVDRRLYE